MRYPRTSPRGKLVIGTMPTHVVCTGEGWDNLTDTRRKRTNTVKSSGSTARKRDRARALSVPARDPRELVAEARKTWEAADQGTPKQEALKRLRILEIRHGYRDASGQSIEIDYMAETWANHG